MNSSMHAIAAKATAPSGNLVGKRGRDSYVLAAADSLLKTTGQWNKWKTIRQNNDTLARKLASYVMERNGLLNQVVAGDKINWNVFDELTAKLSRDGIFLWDKKALFASGWKAKVNSDKPDSLKSNYVNPVTSQKLQAGNQAGKVNSLQPKDVTGVYENNKQDQHLFGKGVDKSNSGLLTAKKRSLSGLETKGQNSQQSQKKSKITQPDHKDSYSRLKESFSAAGNIAGFNENPPPAGAIDFLILDARWNRYTLASGFGAYGSPDKLFMPLGALASILQVPLNVDPGSRTVKGDIQGKNIDLNLDKNTFILGNKNIDIPKNAYLVDEDDIYLDTEILREWLPVDFDYSFRDMSVSLETSEKFPFEERIERQQRWGKLSKPGKGIGVSELKEKTKPDFISVPVVDITASASHDSKAQKPTKGSYTLSGAGNFAGATSHFYATGNDDEYINRIQARLEKTDNDGSLPLGATRLAIGDVNSVGQGGTEQGVMLDSRPLYRRHDFDTTRFEGNLEPGWEVELYRDNTLLDVYTVKEDGLYVFEDVDVYYGNNPFRLVFYGPEGQKREEDRSFQVGRDMLAKNSFDYAASITRQDKTTYSRNSFENEDTGNIRAVGLMEYGLGSKTTLFGGLNTDTDDGERRYRLNAGLGQSFNRASLRLEGIQDLGEGGSSLSASLQSALGNTRIKAGHTLENRFDTDEMINTSEASISGSFGSKETIQFPFTLSAKYSDKDSSYSSYLSLLNSLKTGPVYWSHSIKRNYISSNDDPESIEGRLTASSFIKGVNLRAYGKYNFDETDNGFTDTGISASRMLRPGLRGQASVNRSMGEDEATSLNAQLNWEYKDLTITPKISGDDDGNWSTSVNMKLNTSFGMEPHKKELTTLPGLASYQGHASVRVFEDENQNGIFDETEKGLEGIKVKSLQTGRTAETDKDGIAMLSLFSHVKTDIVIDESSLKDPALSAAGPGEAVTPKPGEIRGLSFPVIRTGEIDGTLYSVNDAGESLILKQVEVFLKNKEGEVIDSVLSEFDGFYLFEKVSPGDYTVEASWTGDDGKEIRKSISANVDETGSIASGIDLVLSDKGNEPLVALGKITEETIQPVKDNKMELFNNDVLKEINEKTTRPLIREGEKVRKVVLYEHGEWVVDKVDTAMPLKKTGASKIKILTDTKKSDVLSKKIRSSKLLHKTPDYGSPVSYGIHAGSYRTMEKALKGIKWARKQMPELNQLEGARIQPVDLGKKGIWFRVILGGFDSRNEAEMLSKKIEGKKGYSKVLTFGTNKETAIELASFNNMNDAEKGIIKLAKRFGSNITDNLAMGIIKKGDKYLAVIQNFKSIKDAEKFRDNAVLIGEEATILNQ